ncbi:DUF4422 domain-containing protein [Chryseobacterium jejuense]|uniref:DUF4422 domain-containing protein n=1 Tax=Chryseobacterium jejuense TaxID=445960 RepID=A0A2X2X0V1_CHRJE|nr:DUF4422 domain-containing protein [Chryseobacterium jejuense]SDJ51274.1 protein of unknown function [Chryseobacterium jejuense]SQB46364.1 Uncharacterised protein [Chryseobacterium jejuense]
MKTKIIIATHKEKSLVHNDIFLPIQVNSEKSGYTIDPNYILDNTLENISEKNYTYNELTALYWAWKNLEDFDIFGLMHYRRYLDIHYKKKLFKKEPTDIIDSVKKDSIKLKKVFDTTQTKKTVEKLLKDFDILLPRPAVCSVNGIISPIATDYKHNHIPADWDICMGVIREKFPEYKNSIEQYLEKGSLFYIGNMFVAKRKIMEEYCSWLFAVLFETEKRITFSEDPYQRRVIGFLSERLFTLYILHNKFRLKQLPILFVES